MVWGGGEKWHYETSVRLLKEGYKVFAVTNHNSELLFRLQSAGIPVLQLKINNFSFLNPLKIIKLYRFFTKNKIHVVILGSSNDLKIGGIVARLAGFDKILYRRGTAIPVKNRLSNRILFKHVLTGVIVNSIELKRALLQNNPDLIDHKNIHLLYNCIDINDFNFPKPFLKYQNKENGEIWLGNGGRLVDQKGQTYLIDLAKILKDRGINFKLLIAGKGKLESMLKDRTIALGLENEIVFLGFVSDMCSFLHSIDIFLLPSLHEGSSNVLLEAMACGKPVVAFDVSSISEMVEHNHTGFLAEFKNVQSFSDWVQCLIDDPEHRMQMGMQGRHRIEEKFNVIKTTKELLGIIE